MKEYIKIAFESRWLDPYMDKPLCERCFKNIAVDVDHIFGRVKNKLNDPYNLSLVCRECHEKKLNTFDNKTLIKEKTKYILDNNLYKQW